MRGHVIPACRLALLVAPLIGAAPVYATVSGSFATRYDAIVTGGGVVTAGASLAGREDAVVNTTASITVSGIPAGSTVQQAFLYWSISGSLDTTATLNSMSVTGTSLGAAGQACWGVNVTGARADVTSLVTGNGNYTVAGLPSSTVFGATDTNGAALVVVYGNALASTSRRIVIRDGNITADASGDVVTDSFSGLLKSASGRFHLIVGDGQAGTDGNLDVEGTTVATNPFSGTDGSLWDVQTYNVSLDTTVSTTAWTQFVTNDCLSFVAAALEFNDPVCGDGVTAGGEDCDDGNLVDGDCCASDCTWEPAAAACDNGDVCTGDACDGAGTCVAGHGAGACDDGNPCTLDTCDGACSSVAAIDPTCGSGTKASLQVSDNPNDDFDTIKWKLSGGPALDQVELGDPAATTGYTLCVFDSSAGVPAVATHLDIAPGASWTNRDPKGLSYKDNSAASDGVTRISIKTGASGKSRISLSAKGAPLPMPTAVSGDHFFGQDPFVRVELRNDATASCWSTQFSAADKNTATSFKAAAP